MAIRMSQRQAAALTLLRDVHAPTPAPAVTFTPPVNGQAAQYFMGLSKLKPEMALQIALMRWLEVHDDTARRLTFASAGGLWTSKRQGSLMKSMGYQRGTPDIFIAYPRGIYHGMFLELKAEDGRPTTDQKQVIAALAKQGYYAVVARGFAAATTAIAEYLARGEALS